MAYLLGVDVGTTSTRALVIEDQGAVISSRAREYPLHTPRPNWAEQDPHEWWTATVASIREATAEAGISSDAIKGVGLSGQMHGSVFLDESDEVIRPAILWCDQRTAKQCESITETVGEADLVAETCNPVLTGFTAPKIIWLREQEPESFARVRRVLLPKDYVRLRLTGEYATEVSDASGTSLFNVPERRWSDLILDRLELPREMLPEVFESPEVSGAIAAEAAAETGLAQGTPVVGGGGDQAAGGVGNGIVQPGVISSTIGTSGVVFAHLDEPVMDAKLRTHTFWNARGVFFGLSLRHTRAHLIRAVMEGVAYGLCDSLAIIEEMGVQVRQVRASGGGARSELWRQIQTDVTGHPHSVINVDEGPAYGVALLAAVGAGLYDTVQDACEATIHVVDTRQVIPEHREIYGGHYALYRRLYARLESSFDAVAELIHDK